MDEEKNLNETQEEDVEVSEQNKKNAVMKEILHLALYCLGIVLATFLIVHYIGQRTVVIGDSMRETLHDGDNLVVDKISYRFNDPQRFDIIVFPYKYEKDTYYIKRIIGLPGETVQITEDGEILINGEVLEENYGREVMDFQGLAYEPISLGVDEYFVLGDNRNYSEDSRFSDVGLIKGDDIIGRAIFRVFPFNNFGKIQNGND